MSRLRILAPWGIFMVMMALVVTPHSASAQAYSYFITPGQQAALGQFSRVGPAVTSYNGTIYLAWAGTSGPSDGEALLNIATSTDGINFSAAVNPLSSTDWSLSNSAPGIAVLNGNIYYAWTGGSNHINIAYAAAGSSLSGAFTSHKSLVNVGGVTQQALGSVALTASNGLLYLAWTGIGGSDQLNIATSPDGVNWSKTTYGYTSAYSPGLASLSTGNVYMGWTSNNICWYINVSAGTGPWTCSGTLPNGGGVYTYSPVTGTTGPGLALINSGALACAFAALPYTSGNALFFNDISAGFNTPVSYEVTPTPTSSDAVNGNPAVLVSGSTTFVYFTNGSDEIEVATFATP